ncbi:MAG: hypothetical protein JWO63_980 [Frankiales bacterium]|nr:hypothetical protein [Frankiales bacterium]
MNAAGDNRDPAAILRAGLIAEAASARVSSDLAERVIAQAESPQSAVGPNGAGGGLDRGSRAWRSWLLPLAAAVVIAILIGSAVTAVRLVSGGGDNSGGQPAPLSPQPTQSAPTPAPSSDGPAQSSTAPTPSSAATGGPTSSVTAAGPSGPVPAGFRATDVTWISLEDGWALGTAPCATAPCTSIVRTSDGGKSWVGIPAPKAYLYSVESCPSQTAACVTSLRFANAEVGYAFGQNSLFMTVDAGRTWQRQTGGALSLEVADGTALRLSTKCLPGCPLTVASAPVGSSAWTDAGLPNNGADKGGELVRAGREVVVANYGNPAGGAGKATTALSVSSDDGVSWSTVDEPCPQGASATGEVDTRGVTVAPDASITVLCVSRLSESAPSFTMTSTDGGRDFTRAATSPGAAASTPIAAGAATDLLVSASSGVARSTDGGATWRTVLPRVYYLGFESSLVGRALVHGPGVGAAALLSTTDGGANWTSAPFN